MSKQTNSRQTSRSRPQAVTVVAIVQALIGLAFLSIPIIGLMYGAQVQTAVDAEMVRQGHSTALLTQNHISFTENGAATIVPTIVALIMITLAWLNLAGKRAGLILSWVLQPLVLAGNFLIMASQAAVVSTLESVFKSTGDAALQSLNVQKLVDAAFNAYPSWVSSLVNARNVVVILGSILILILLAIPSTRGYFRKATAAAN
ncbi:MAG TPA: hypothetical protein VMT30_05035 [Candidatus Saccharimonadia bacterium]|nr:hypothetical protein [Candidatus Saccharimonadia bacterium]